VISIVAGDNSSGTQGRLQESQHIEIIIRHPRRDPVARLRQDKGQLARLIRSLKDQSLLEARTDAGDRRSVPLIQPARAAAAIKSFSN